jgi:hypothetical protein
VTRGHVVPVALAAGITVVGLVTLKTRTDAAPEDPSAPA